MIQIEVLSILSRILNIHSTFFCELAPLSEPEVRHRICENKNLSLDAWKEFYFRASSLFKKMERYKILYPGHPFYPMRFYELSSPPVFLCTQGELSFLEEPLLTVVGSRRTLTPFTDWLNDQFAHFLKESHVTVVSGGAYGIDAQATQLSLFCGKPSILILPSGFERSYPSHTKHWLTHKLILALSEYFPEESVRNYHFVHRNRLLGAISPYVFAVQCSLKSGTMTTVRAALDCSADIFVLPSFPGHIESSGNIQLLKEGAQLVSHREDLKLGMGMFSPNPNRKH